MLPKDGSDSAWVQWASTASPLQLTVALSPREIRKVSIPKETLFLLRKAGKLEFAARVNDDPPLPLIYDSELALNFLSSNDPIHAAKMNYAEDVAGQTARAKFEIRSLTGEDPKGFVPGNGSLSLPVVDALKSQSYLWTLGSFPEGEWRNGSILTASTAQEKTFWVYAAHSLSGLLHDPKWYLNPPKKSVSETRELVAQLLKDIAAANRDSVTPIIVFDEKRAAVI